MVHPVRSSFITLALILATAALGSGETRVLAPSKDNTLYNVPDGSLSNGAGAHLHTGRNSGGMVRRAVLAFDLSSIPANSTITTVQLTLTLSRTKNGAPRVTTLHRLLENWGEGGSHADRGEGGGAPAQPGDATWTHRFFPDQSWILPGGTYAGEVSASKDVGDLGVYTWDSTPELVADVQSWIVDPTGNYGWILVGDESGGGSTSKRFDSKDNPSIGNHPELMVIYTSAQSPVASFEWRPNDPTVGQEIQFTDTSSRNPDSWLWDFDDGTTSTEQNPRHSYLSPGEYTVTLTATNANGSGTASTLVAVGEGGPNLTEMTFIAAAANAPGVGSSFFVTDVDVNNSGTITLTYQFLWLPRDSNNLSPVQSELFSLEPGETFRHENVLASVFSLERAAGALAIASDSDAIRVMSRTFNQSVNGTFGQSFAGLPTPALVPANQRVRLLFMTENAEFRSNLGLLNGVDRPVTIKWELFAPDGTSLHTGELDLEAWSNHQLNRVFSDFAPIKAAYVDVWTESPGAAFSCYGSVLDASSSDPTTVLPQ